MWISSTPADANELLQSNVLIQGFENKLGYIFDAFSWNGTGAALSFDATDEDGGRT